MNVPAKTRRRPFKTLLPFPTALLLVLGAASGDSHDFLFWSYNRFERPFHPYQLQTDVAWDVRKWPPGATLPVAFTVSDFTTRTFRSIAEFESMAEYALSTWSDIENADIRLNVEAVAPHGELAGHRGIIVTYAQADPTLPFPFYSEWVSNYANLRTRGFDGRAGFSYQIQDCDVYMLPSKIPHTPESFLYVLLHELGHCLGLDHSLAYPFDPHAYRILVEAEYRGRGVRHEPFWGWEGSLASGGVKSLTTTQRPSLDEEVAASWARPGAGWLEETGSLWGVVLIEDDPAQAVYVLASPISRPTGQVGAGVGTFTGENGTFLIRGLPPGEYVLWVFDMDLDRTGWVGRLDLPSLMEEPTDHIYDTIWRRPVIVGAGGRTGPVVIPVRHPQVSGVGE